MDQRLEDLKWEAFNKKRLITIKTDLNDIISGFIDESNSESKDYYICPTCYLEAIADSIEDVAAEILENDDDTYDNIEERDHVYFVKYLNSIMCLNVEDGNFPSYDCTCNA